MEPAEPKGDDHPMRAVAGAVLGVLLLALLAAPLVVGRWGPWRYRAPAELGAPPTREKRSGRVTGEQADIEGLKKRLAADINALVAPLGKELRTGRAAGSAGAAAVAELIRQRFEKAGAQVCVQEFPVTVPVTLESSLVVGEPGQSYPVRPFWPNAGRTCTVTGEIKAPLVFGGDGRLESLAGREVAGSILVLDGDRGLDWVTAGSLGARAVVFLEPASPWDVQAGSKVLTAALDLPRFWLSRAEGLQLVAAIEKARAEKQPPTAALKCRVDWQNRTARNVYGLVPGTNPAKQKGITVVLVPSDSPSLVPDLAPGAEPAANLAAVFELLERFKARPPERPVLFLAVGAHYQAMLGEQHAAELLRRPVAKLLEGLGELDGRVLGVDAQDVLMAGGFPVKGLAPWQRVVLIVLAAALVAGAVLIIIFLRAGSGARWLSAVAVVFFGAVVLTGLGSYLARERKATPAEIAESQREPWKSCAYSEFRAELRKLERVRPEAARGLLAVVERREAAERAAVEARGRVLECLKEEESRVKGLPKDTKQYSGPPAEWLASFRQATAALEAAARAAVDFQGAGGQQPGAPGAALADYQQMRALLEGARSQSASGAVEACLMALANLEERHKNESAGRLKYLRWCGYLSFLGTLGPDLPERVKSCVGLDLSSHSQRMAAFFKGKYVNQFIQKDEKRLQTAAAPLVEFLAAAGADHAAAVGWKSTEDSPMVQDTSASLGDRPTAGYPACPYYGAEVFTLVGVPAVTLGTAFDGRRLLDSPVDLPEHLDLDSLARQTEVAVRTLLDALGPGPAGPNGLASLEKMESESGALRESDYTVRIAGLVTEYNPAKSRTLSVTPVPGALVFSRREAREYRGSVRPTYAPVRSWAAAIADEWGGYEFFALPAAAVREWNDQEQRLLAFQLDAPTGRIVQTLDDGEQGAKRGLPWRTPKRNEDEYFLATFACSALNVFEASDLRSYEGADTQFNDVRIFIGQNDAVPISWGVSMAGETPNDACLEHALVLFVSERRDPRTDEPLVTRVKATFGRRRLAGVRWPFLAVPGEGWQTGDRAEQKKIYEGKGVDVHGSSRVVDRDSGKRIPAAMMMAQDLYRLDDYRLYVLDKAGVRNASLLKQHEAAGRELARAQEAAASRQWDRMLSAARASWGFEARAYPNIQATITDVVKGLLFYLFLMLPFAYFVERLLFAFPDINRQLAGVFGVFMVAFALLYLMHPAFRITSSAPMILLAFVTVALAVLVISMISSRFKRELEVLQHRPGRSHKADMDRFNAALSAFLLGINNMRRRKVRTVLTLVTLVLLTFSVLSFSSIESTLGANKRPIAQHREQPYQGVLVRNESWQSLDEFAYRCLRTEFATSGECTVAARAWLAGQGLLINTAAAGSPESAFGVSGLLGVQPQEREVTGLGREEITLEGRREKLLVAGRPFRPGEESARVCLLPERLMAELGFKEKDYLAAVRPEARLEDLPAVTIAGERLAVIGVLADAAWYALKDIDDESPVPINYEVENWQRMSGRGSGSEAAEFRKYTHIDPRYVPVVPYDWLLDHGGKLFSVALVPSAASPEAAAAKAVELAEDKLLRRVSVPMFVSAGQTVTFMSTARSSDVSGVGSLLVPMLIAALIVLNTMLGAVYEREKEISIYGALGLAPVHIGSLFIAESAVFAVVSAVLGYVLGQSVAKLVVLTNAAGLLGGISLNYSSLSAVFSACFIIAVVMLSAAYPAFRAGRLSVPDVERIWKFPRPEGDRLVFDFPFTVSGEQALGVNMHLVHFFQDHANQSVGEFYTADTAFARRGSPGAASGYRLASRVWIAPFDFGISQSLELSTYLAADEKDIYETRMVLTRVSGSPEAWVKMNHRFMKSIRKQFLLWRLFTPQERAWHVAQARALLGEAPPAEPQARPAADSGAAAAPNPG